MAYFSALQFQCLKNFKIFTLKKISRIQPFLTILLVTSLPQVTWPLSCIITGACQEVTSFHT